MWKAIAAGRIALPFSAYEHVAESAEPADRGDVAPRRRTSVRRRTSPTPATAPQPTSKGEGIDLLTPARSRRRGV